MAEYVLTFLYYCPVWIFLLSVIMAIVVILIVHYMILKILNKRRMVAGVIVILSVAMIVWITLLTRKSYRSQIDLIPFHFILGARKHPHILRAAFMNGCVIYSFWIWNG